MKAVGFKTPGKITRKDALIDITLDKPVASGRDLLVKIHAVSVNPADSAARKMMADPEGGYTVIGYDGAGVVEAIGDDVTLFEVGDEVYYSGTIDRLGTNAEFHLVDERIVGHKPTSISHAEAAALPLTTLAAWEGIFDRLDVNRPVPEGNNLILVIGGSGGVGTIAIQMLRAITNLTIISTASTPETTAWVKKLGAHHVINHHEPIAAQVTALGFGAPGFVLSTNGTAGHIPQIAELIAPQGRFTPVDAAGAVDLQPFGMKSVSINNFTMFTRPLFHTPDMRVQGEILNEVAKLVDAGKIKSTVTNVLGKIDAKTLIEAHTQIESGKTRGKIVLEGF
ncbi:Alcohol dehydrogenase, zinc-binding protein [Paraglaciecola sp. T6c]|uniref:zinc-binding alcohol dehydrogenase family protein n=1 Tax=Pseudoalteromonas atlantica (strain T6c / ATCC BAA-1087) TaxID=3042615 RepID=UPI00005C737F|nr:zinc-binding alcohol dehydrogenase family protein [Paraglaciecola sp. T6c]ABG42259.1 Alcohol dehydrogenase, zinc-binding protein [Paraglaciecola sp. T6c]